MRPKKSKINNTIIEEKGYKATHTKCTYRRLQEAFEMFVQNNHIRENIHTCNLLSVTKGILVVKAFLMNLIVFLFSLCIYWLTFCYCLEGPQVFLFMKKVTVPNPRCADVSKI